MSHHTPTPPLFRRNDPATSREAGEHMIESGKLAEAQSRVLEMVRRAPGLTSLMLAEVAGEWDPRVINRRLPELERLGLVRRGEAKRQGTGRRAVTWWPV